MFGLAGSCCWLITLFSILYTFWARSIRAFVVSAMSAALGWWLIAHAAILSMS